MNADRELDKFIGLKYDDVKDDIAEFSNDIRIWVPGMMGTTDWIPTRLNVDLTEEGIITGFRNG